MKYWMAPLAAAGLLILSVALRAQQPAGGGRTVWDGVYSDPQVKRGTVVYEKYCVKCHGEQLMGDGTASALTGTGFMADFNGVTLGELVDRTRQTMPDDDPGSMSRQQITDVIAYVLNFNKFPSGETDLPPQAEVLNQIRFLAAKPSADRQESARRHP
jgi:mono/diheme cytochrome c family protein